MCLPLAILRDDWLPIVVTRLSSLDTIGQDVSDGRRMPNVVLARWRPRLSGIQLFGDLTTAQLFFHHRGIDISYDSGFHGFDHDLWRVAMTFW